MNRRIVPIVLCVPNALVLLGQVWPQGAPPFARAVNIAFLAATLHRLWQAGGCARDPLLNPDGTRRPQ